ncbi:MAG: hypothetical protein IH939_11170, partial [Acidobacteria bacterium]|nr:hypothetical protein [Acidobacteriota bacterium]
GTRDLPTLLADLEERFGIHLPLPELEQMVRDLDEGLVPAAVDAVDATSRQAQA